MRLAIFLCRLAHHFFSTPSGFIGGGEGRIFRQPHIKVGKVRKILWKKVALETAGSESSASQKYKRAEKDLPAMIDSPFADSVIKGGKALFTTLLNRRLRFGLQQE